MRRYILPIIIFLLFIAEGSFVELLPANAFHVDRVFVPRFLLISLIFMTIYHDKTQGLIYGIVFGLFYDVIYTGVLGVYMFSMPLISYILSKASKVLQTNILIISLLSVIGVALLEFFVYGVNLLIGIAPIAIDGFIQSRLFPTIILNSAFVILFSYPLKRFLSKIKIVE